MNAKLKFWIVVSLVAVFAIGVAVGYFGERYVVHHRHEQRGDKRGDGLSLEQQDRIREIVKKNEAVLETFSGEFHQHLGELREKLMEEVKAVLTPEQRAKLDARIREFKEKRRKEQEDKGEAR
jgi:Spy/CpxP family protein refolding chaperone